MGKDALQDAGRASTILEAAIFDLGGVVFGISLDRIIQSWAKSAGCNPRDIAPKFKVDTYYELFETDDISPQQYRDHVCNIMGFNISSEEFDRGWNSLYLDLLPGIESLLEQLRKTLRLVVLTNTNQIHALEWRIRYSEVLKYFEKIFASHEIKARKPTPQSFQIVLDYLGTAPENTVFIDDNLENVNAAIAMGIKGIVATTPHEVSEKLKKMDYG